MLAAAAVQVEPIEIDRSRSEDEPWIREKWIWSEARSFGILRTGRHTSALPIADKQTMGQGLDRRVRRLLAVSDARVARSGSRIVGFSVASFEQPIIHYIYVSSEMTHRGIGLRLVRHIVGDPWAFTHSTRPGLAFAEAISKMKGCKAGRFDPYLLEGEVM